MNRTALVTGASSGIGKATAQALHAKSYRVIGTSRDADALPDTARIAGVEYRSLDLADIDSIDGFAADLGRVDVLINNAGESQSGPLEELPMDAIERLFRVNVFGPVRLTQQLLPAMRQHGYGRVVMVGSMIASFPLPHRSSYTASKAAIKGFAEAARLELSPYGIWLSTVEPGSIATGISSRRTKYITDNSPYKTDFDRVISELHTKESAGIAAEEVAATILRAVAAGRPIRIGYAS
jgi:short-subunit dehydrogenase